MNLEIPNFQLPFEIPTLIHPMIVHFAIALPIIWLLLELINLIAKRKILSGITLFFAFLTIFIFFGAYLTGKADASLSNINLETLKLHKNVGIYLVYGSLALLIIKFFSFIIQKSAMKILFIFSLIVFIAVTIFEGKKGGELVYQYGVNVKINNSIKNDKNRKIENKEEIRNKDSNKSDMNPLKEIKKEYNESNSLETKEKKSNIKEEVNLTDKKNKENNISEINSTK